jgi:hypothetical protein
MSIEANNVFCGTNGATVASGDLIPGHWYKVFTNTVTYNSVIRAVGSTFQAVTGVVTFTGTGTIQRNWTVLDILRDDYASYDVHVRISEKETGGAYIVKFWGIVDPASIEYEVYDYSKPESWLIKFEMNDCIQQLKKVTAFKWMGAGDGLTAPEIQYGGLLHTDYDYSATTSFLTYVGPLNWGGIPYPPGRYIVNQVFRKDFQHEYGQWYHASLIRYIKIVDIFSAISTFLGLEASVNNGGTWSDFHSWRYYFNTNNSTGGGGETLDYVGIDELYVWSCFDTGTEYIESYGFFDPQLEASAPHSWKTASDPLEVLDRICSSHGLVYRVRVNASNERYLEIIESAKVQSTLTVSGATWNRVLDLKTTVNTFACDGVEIVSTPSAIGASDQASNTVRGGGGSGSLKYDQYFTTANHLRVSHSFRSKVNEGGDVSGASYCDVRPMDVDFTCALYTLQSITDKTATGAYSICMIMPMSNGTAASGDPGNVPDYAEYDGTLGGVVVPNRNDPYNSWIEVPAMALALNVWSDADEATDPVAFTRPHGDEIELSLVNVDHTATVYPPIKLVVTEAYQTRNYVITEVEEQSSEDVTAYRGHTRDV